MNEIKKHIAECGEAVTPPAVINARHTLLFLLSKFMKITTKRKVYKNLTKAQISLIAEICINPQLTQEIYNCYFSLKNWNDCDNIKVNKMIETERLKRDLKNLSFLLINQINEL